MKRNVAGAKYVSIIGNDNNVSIVTMFLYLRKVVFAMFVTQNKLDFSFVGNVPRECREAPLPNALERSVSLKWLSTKL